jgi:glutathione synthase/RimK-type ligase-like ATP-grasp enzyme
MKKFKIGIHHTHKGTFSEYWIAYCKKNHVDYKIVNCYHNNIISHLEDCDVLMWHHDQGNPKDLLFAKQLLFSLEQSGKKVFPDFNTAWHFDDKLGQKYLLEASGVNLVNTYAFYSKQDALNWINETNFPKVFKLRGGAGSATVKLAKTKTQAKKLVKTAFGRGFKMYNPWYNLYERWRLYRMGKNNFNYVLRGIGRLVYRPQFASVPPEKGYVYFQDFIPNNDHDIRVVVINKKAFAIKRMTRENDFRASGSGNILYEKSLFDEGLIKKSFEIASKLKLQCMAIDYVFLANEPKVVEISYGFSIPGYINCEGYWDENMKWYAGSNFDFCGWMVEGLIENS